VGELPSLLVAVVDENEPLAVTQGILELGVVVPGDPDKV
jgi:hypothetical protein